MFQVKNNILACTKTRTLTPKQQALMSQLTPRRQQEYMLRLLGIVKGSISLDRFKSYEKDLLSCKPDLSVLTELRQLRNLSQNHTPSNKNIGEWIGVEIECLIPHQDDDTGENGYWEEEVAHDYLKAAIKRAGITRCTVKDDGSVDDQDDVSGHGVEVTLLFNAAQGFEQLEKLCQVLDDVGCFVNSTCGLHVHLDARHLAKIDVKRIGKRLGHTLPVLKWMVDDSRHENEYCKLEVSPLIDRQRFRYCAINLTSYYKFETIEVRLHGGSTNFKKIKNWIEILRLIGQADIKRDVTTFQEFIEVTNLPDRLIEYAEKRITRLNKESWSILMPVPEVNLASLREHEVPITEPRVNTIVNLNQTNTGEVTITPVAVGE